MKSVNSCGERIKQALLEKGLKQIDLANYLNVDKATITNYINNKYSPKADRLQQISEFLKVDIVWLLGYDVPMEKPAYIEEIKTDDSNLIVASMEELTDEQRKTIVDMIAFYNSQNEKKE